MTWKCKNCKTESDDSLEVCWKCGYNKDGSHSSDVKEAKQIIVQDPYPTLRTFLGVTFCTIIFIIGRYLLWKKNIFFFNPLNAQEIFWIFYSLMSIFFSFLFIKLLQKNSTILNVLFKVVISIFPCILFPLCIYLYFFNDEGKGVLLFGIILLVLEILFLYLIISNKKRSLLLLNSTLLIVSLLTVFKFLTLSYFISDFLLSNRFSARVGDTWSWRLFERPDAWTHLLLLVVFTVIPILIVAIISIKSIYKIKDIEISTQPKVI
jgi:hypothetical protein